MSVPDTVFRTWRYREKIELEASDLFARLAKDLAERRGRSDEVVTLAMKAAADEQRHAELCREIVGEGPEPFVPIKPELGAVLGPPKLNLDRRILYSCVALCCVTETLSTALLVEMKGRAVPELIRKTVHEILEDEVMHSRIGWAELARIAGETDVKWLSQYLPGMIREALALDIKPMLSKGRDQMDLSPWGILPAEAAKPIMFETVEKVILPGLEKYGIDTADAHCRLN